MMLPFRLSRLFGIVVQVRGMAIANQEGIRLEFQDAEDPPKNFLDADIQSVLITWENLEDFACQRGLVSDEVKLRVRSIESLGNLPGIQDHELSLEVRKSERDALKAFERTANECRKGQQQVDVDELLDDVRDFLHGL